MGFWPISLHTHPNVNGPKMTQMCLFLGLALSCGAPEVKNTAAQTSLNTPKDSGRLMASSDTEGFEELSSKTWT